MAVISLDLASVATWPSAIPSSLAQALTMCSAPRPLAAVVRAAAGLAVDGDEAVRGRRRRPGSRRRSRPGSSAGRPRA